MLEAKQCQPKGQQDETINDNNKELDNIKRTLTMLEKALKRILRRNYYHPNQYPGIISQIEEGINTLHAWINDYKIYSVLPAFHLRLGMTINELGVIIKQAMDIEPFPGKRPVKRKQIISRAAIILKHWEEDGIPETQEITNEVLQSIKVGEIQKWGPENLPAGPDMATSDEIIIVEGRADILNLLRCGVGNTIAVQGTNIPKSIVELSKQKECTVFLDGDRGGDLILKELVQVAKIKYVLRAPAGKEVEDHGHQDHPQAVQDRSGPDHALHLDLPAPEDDGVRGRGHGKHEGA